MHEVEVKAALKNKEKVIEALKALGCTLGESITEKDVLYAKKCGSHEEYVANAEFLRIRERGNGEVIFTFKYHPERHAGRPDSMPLEYETSIGSPEALTKMLELMGYEESVRVNKTRQKGKYGKWEVCLDEVEGLGCFMELEELAEENEAKRIIDEMLGFFEQLGVAREDTFAQRYDIALLQKRWGV